MPHYKLKSLVFRWESANFFCKKPDVNILIFVGPQVSITATDFVVQRAAIDKMQTKGCGCVPIEVHVQKQAARGIWPKAQRLITRIWRNC